ncbi:MAG: oligosaccharide flippase family protein [Rhizomicrobium sp.]
MSPPKYTLRYNIAANYVSQVYLVAVGIVMAPVYLSYMGAEAYGLIGFFTMMTSWFQLLDIGLTPTLVRETARFRGGVIGAGTLRSYLRALEAIFGAVSVLGAAVMILFSDQIAAQWLQVKVLPLAEVSQAIVLMGLTVPLRWVAGLYRGVVAGFERQVWLASYNIVIATCRFVGVLAVFHVFGASPVNFFAYQLIVALAEMLGLAAMTYRLVAFGAGPREPFSWKPLRANVAFSLTIAFTATIWVVISQTDKLVLSKLLPLAGYGVFSLAAVAAGALNSIGGPLGQALLPRLTKLVAERDTGRAVQLYGDATQVASVLAFPAVAILCFFAGPILRAWTGNPSIAEQAAPILRLYAIGNGFVILNAFAYYIQYAYGDLRLHFLGNALIFVLLVPLLVFGAEYYGAVGTGAAWAAVNGLYAIAWVPLIHARLMKGRHWRWVTRDILSIALPSLAAGWLLSAAIALPAGRWPALAVVAASGAVVTAAACAGSSLLRSKLAQVLAPRLARLSGPSR